MSLPTNGPKAANLAASKRYLASCPVATPMDCVWLHQKAGDTEFRRVLRVSRSTYTFHCMRWLVWELRPKTSPSAIPSAVVVTP